MTLNTSNVELLCHSIGSTAMSSWVTNADEILFHLVICTDSLSFSNSICTRSISFVLKIPRHGPLALQFDWVYLKTGDNCTLNDIVKVRSCYDITKMV